MSTEQEIKKCVDKDERKKWTRVIFYGKIIPKYRKHSNLYQRTYYKEINGNLYSIYELKRGK